MDKRQFHKPRFYNKLQSNYQIGTSMEHLSVLPTSTNINLNDVKKNEFMRDWTNNTNNTTVIYVFEKHVNAKKPVFSAIASAGLLNLDLNEKYILQHDQTGAKICEATLKMTVEPSEYNDPNRGTFGFKSMSLMVFK